MGLLSAQLYEFVVLIILAQVHMVSASYILLIAMVAKSCLALNQFS